METLPSDQIPTHPEAQLQPFDAVKNAHLEPEILKQEGLLVHDLAQGGVEIDIDTMQPLEVHNNTALLGVMDVAGRGVKIYGMLDQNRKLVKDFMFLAPGDYHPSQDEKYGLNDARPIRIYPLTPNDEDKVFGREGLGARLGLSHDASVSRRHFSAGISHDGKLRLGDVGSLNGTSLITAEPRRGAAEQHPQHYEVEIDHNHFRVVGAFPAQGRGDVFVMESADEEGNHRQFMVYKSMSEGGWRASQGFEPDARYMKGPENSPYTQYTQDTQLHPKFAKLIQSITATNRPLPMVGSQELAHSEAEVDRLMADFEAQVEVRGWPHEALNNELFRTRAGDLRANELMQQLGARDAHDLPDALRQHVARINQGLVESDAIPNFEQPESVEHDQHGSLGPITREVYTHVVGGRKVEWHMAYDSQGRVWIDRMRFAGSKATAYGTDQEMLYSGILTSKPIEYKKQLTGLPAEYKAGDVGGYEDISKLLDTFAPVQKFRAQRGIRK